MPILEGRGRDRALRTIREISRTVADHRWDQDGPAFAGGRAGAALFDAYLARSGLDDAAFDRAVCGIERSLEEASMLRAPSLFSGLAGVGWVLAQMSGTVVDVEDDDPGDAIDEALTEFLRDEPLAAGYDLVDGLVGFGVYALERRPSPTASQLLNRIVNLLDETAERGTRGVAWFTPPELLRHAATRAEFPNGYYNLGVAHGVPGVIGVLARRRGAGIASRREIEMLDGAVRWVLAQRLSPAAGSAFPYHTGPGIRTEASRSAWCYGDPGVAATLLLAARAAGDPEWEAVAVAIARDAVSRHPDRSGVSDASICHGAAGLMHLYNRLFQTTGDGLFADAARTWCKRIDALMPPKEMGFLEGAAGVGLALLAACTELDPLWDRVLLLS